MSFPDDDDLSEIESLSLGPSSEGSKSHKRTTSRSEKRSSRSHRSEDNDKDRPPTKEKRRVTVYDASTDARTLADALSHTHVKAGPINDILPHLTHDQILLLRTEYKKHAKVQGRGINIAKHLKLKLTGNYGKAAHVTALGRFESEGYWANFFYQAHSSRHELLIEALMGRSNAEMRAIIDGFRDKRYHDDLRKCMERELKPDKFRAAVLVVLEARRQEETEVYAAEYKARDADVLRRCIEAREGGESAMLEIVCRRSDAHLREVMQLYERVYGANFARDALRKSNNLVVSCCPLPNRDLPSLQTQGAKLIINVFRAN